MTKPAKAHLFLMGPLAIAWVIGMLGCTHSRPQQAETQAPKASGVVGFDVMPLADGGAYAIDYSANPRTIWYIVGSDAEKVSLPSDLDASIPMDIYPLASGGALLTDALEQVWFLKGTQAIRVKDKTAREAAAAVPVDQSPGARWAWAMWQRTAAKARQEAEAKEGVEVNQALPSR